MDINAVPPVIFVHAICAGLVLLLGPVVLLRRSRDRVHQVLGRVWVVTIILVCLTSFGIMPHGFSWLHGLSIFTLFTVTMGFLAIRRGDVRVHRGNMVGSYLGTLGAFIFAAVVPQRLIPTMLREEPVVLGVTVAAIVLAVALSTWATIATNPKADDERGSVGDDEVAGGETVATVAGAAHR